MAQETTPSSAATRRSTAGNQALPKDNRPRGEPGPSGQLGEAGPRGEQGLPGERGEQGEQGQRGERGEQGEQGQPGERGERGEQGQPGERGERGEQGQPGEQGPVGAQGQVGEQGPVGEQGAVGEPGPAGPPGPQGKPGPQGLPGPQGQQGWAPEPGDQPATRWTSPVDTNGASSLGSGVEAGLALAFMPAQLFASAFENVVKMQQQTWAALTSSDARESSEYRFDHHLPRRAFFPKQGRAPAGAFGQHDNRATCVGGASDWFTAPRSPLRRPRWTEKSADSAAT